MIDRIISNAKTGKAQKIVENGEVVLIDEDYVQRQKISQSSKDTFVTEENNFQDAKSSGDLQAQIDALNNKINDLFHIVTGETIEEAKEK